MGHRLSHPVCPEPLQAVYEGARGIQARPRDSLGSQRTACEECRSSGRTGRLGRPWRGMVMVIVVLLPDAAVTVAPLVPVRRFALERGQLSLERRDLGRVLVFREHHRGNAQNGLRERFARCLRQSGAILRELRGSNYPLEYGSCKLCDATFAS